MADFYVKKNKVSYELSNGKKLIDEHDRERDKDKVLKDRLNKMEETINFKDNFKPYDFSFIDFSKVKIIPKNDKTRTKKKNT